MKKHRFKYSTHCEACTNKVADGKVYKKKQIKAYTNGLVHQFWFEDGVLHLWVNTRSGIYTIPFNKDEELVFLADLSHKLKIEEGTVYEFKEIHEVQAVPER